MKFFKLWGFLMIGILCHGMLCAQNIPLPTSTNANNSAQKTPPVYTIQPANYQRVFTALGPIKIDSLLNLSAAPEDVATVTSYNDTYGRSIQTVVKQGSPQKKDVVVPTLYDEFNRVSVSYLPFTNAGSNTGLFTTNPFQQDSAFYKTQYANEPINYGLTIFDGTPWGIPLKVMSPGNSWAGSGIGIQYAHRTNKISDSVRLWTIAIAGEDDVPATTLRYDTGTLVVKQLTDERGIKTLQYIDQLGRTVLSKSQMASLPTTGHSGWLCTYYVYDEAGLLRCVIPPKAVEALNTPTTNWNLAANATINTNLCFGYWYDSRGRLLMKRIPGKGKTYMAYDLLDRVVLTQDANLRSTSQWSFTKYDGQSRPDTTGLITLAGQTAAQLQVAAAASADYPLLTGTFTITSENYYDDYGWTTGKPVNGTLDNTNVTTANFNTSYNISPEYAQPIVQSNRIRGYATGQKKLVIGTNTYLYTSLLYDENGKNIQSKQSNYTGGTDVITVQYSYSGRVLRSHLQSQKAGAGSQNHSLLTKYAYDHAGRVKSIAKNIDGKGDKVIAQNSYNELGQLITKKLGAVETQNYAYNIRGWLRSINDSFVTTAGSTSNYFGEVLSYDAGFTSNQLNGNIAGIKWKGASDGIARAYGYSYDNTNRLTGADFSQQNQGSTNWTSDKADFSVSNLGYDENGNILKLKQRGLTVNTNSTVDSLSYQYFATSNQLQKISDGIADNGPWGDFKDTALAADDYVYDVNGNIVKDNNKHIHTSGGGNGIVYNYLNKPDNITVGAKGSISYVYDAGGATLQKTITDNNKNTKTVITYVSGFVYQKTLAVSGTASTVPDTLQYVLHEEGRIRNALKKNSQSGALYYAFEYDYFLKDHQGNVRSTVTEGRDTAIYVATMEPGNQVAEQQLFDNEYDPVNTVVAKPAGFDNVSGNTQVVKLNSTSGYNKKTGPGLLLKVMTGDKVQLSTYAFYNTATQAPSGTSPLTELLTAMSEGVTGTSGGKFGAGNLSATNGAITGAITTFLSSGRPYSSTTPKAYLNWILLDEQLNIVPGSSSAMQVQAGSSKIALAPGMLTMPKSGYLYVYVSNESPQDVYFDDITVQHFKGALLQEQSYYPFGGDMKAISSEAAVKMQTRYKYNAGTELESSFDINYYETYYRNYDAQVGRFTGVDALSEITFDYSPYSYALNDPVYWNDPSGLVVAGPAELPGVTVTTYIAGSGGGYDPGSFPCFNFGGGLDFTAGGGGGQGRSSGGGRSGGSGGESGGGGGSVVIGSGSVSGIAGNANGSGGGRGGGGGGEGINTIQYAGNSPKAPPIFWEEYWYPNIEAIDYEFSNTFYGSTMVITLPQYPNVKFLEFHYEKSIAQQTKNGDAARDANNVLNPNGKIFNLHEVPYKSTKEGGARSIMRPALDGENKSHGATLGAFYGRYNLQDRDPFLVPLYKPTIKIPVPSPVFSPKRQPENPPFWTPFLAPLIESAEAAEIIEWGWLIAL